MSDLFKKVGEITSPEGNIVFAILKDKQAEAMKKKGTTTTTKSKIIDGQAVQVSEPVLRYSIKLEHDSTTDSFANYKKQLLSIDPTKKFTTHNKNGDLIVSKEGNVIVNSFTDNFAPKILNSNFEVIDQEDLLGFHSGKGDTGKAKVTLNIIENTKTGKRYLRLSEVLLTEYNVSDRSSETEVSAEERIASLKSKYESC